MSDFIFITCPQTSQPVSTGFRAPRGTRISELRKVTLAPCPACGKAHSWNGDMAFWDDEPENPSLWQEVMRIWRPRQGAL